MTGLEKMRMIEEIAGADKGTVFIVDCPERADFHGKRAVKLSRGVKNYISLRRIGVEIEGKGYRVPLTWLTKTDEVADMSERTPDNDFGSLDVGARFRVINPKFHEAYNREVVKCTGKRRGASRIAVKTAEGHSYRVPVSWLELLN